MTRSRGAPRTSWPNGCVARGKGGREAGTRRASMRLAERQSVGWFLVVGCLAGLAHYVTTLSLNGLAAVPAGIANAFGFLLAFPVSYFGHRRLSFAGAGVPHRRALPRLFTVSALAFMGNQALLLALLRYTGLPLSIALAIVLGVVALSTFILSRAWVFARHPAP